MFRLVTILLAIAGVVTAMALIRKTHTVPPAPPPLKQPTKSPFDYAIGARGIIESVDENVRIAPVLAGLVTEVKVEVGQQVKKGDILFQQDDRDPRALATVQEAQIASLQTQIEQAQITVADRKDQWERIERLGESKVSSTDERQRAKFAAEAAVAALSRARADLQAAEATLSRIRVQIELLTVRAPRDGTILQVNVRGGEYAPVNPDEPLILLGRLDRFQIRADVDEDNAGQVVPGARAFAQIKGRPEPRIPLQFIRIEPYVVPKRSLTGESNERVDTRVLQIIYQFDRKDMVPLVPVYVGQQMDVVIDGRPVDSTPRLP